MHESYLTKFALFGIIRGSSQPYNLKRRETVMGMGSIPCHAQITTREKLLELCPEEMRACEESLKRAGLNWGQFAVAMQTEEEILSEVTAAFEKLCLAFEAKTRVGDTGLSLELCYYDADSGDRYDEIDAECGGVFVVGGVYKFSEAGEKFQRLWKEASWIVFG